MKKDNLENLFERLKGTFDTEEPAEDHKERFIEKLNNSNGVVSITRRTNSWWKSVSVAASIGILCMIGYGVYNSEPTLEEQVSEISPEVSRTEFYFVSLIENQIVLLESENTPETNQIIADTMVQLEKLELDYEKLEKDLLNGGNSKLILSAMIMNFQTRLDMLQDVLNKIESIKSYKNYNDAKTTI